jgi:multiple sugar transport system substrate-binding protein
MTIQRISRLAALLSAVLLLSSCGRKQQPPPPSPAGEPTKVAQSQGTITIAVYAGGREGAIEGPLWHWKEKWEARRGWTLNIVPIPYAQLRERVLTDLRTGIGQYDGFIVPDYYYGDLIDGGYIVPIDSYLKDDRFPQWDPDCIVPILKPLHQWGGKWYGAPNDGDAQILYYRKDLLSNPQWQEKYHQATGHKMPVPPRTWEEALSIAQFFTGRDFSGDGKPDYGISLELKPNDQSFNHFLAITAPYVVNPGPKVDRYHNVYWFDPETMEPLVDSPGHLEGLKMLLALFKCAPRAALSFGLEDTWNLFLSGQAVLCPTFGDLGALAQDENKSKVRGQVGCATMPGSQRLWSFEKKQWLTLDEPNMVANMLGASWHGLISKFSKHPDIAYDLFAFHAQREVSVYNATHGWTGINPLCSFHFLPPQGDGKLEDYVEAGWDQEDIQQYLNAYYQNYYKGSTYLAVLRVPQAEEFFNVLDRWMLQAVGGQVAPEEALQEMKRGWQEIIDREGQEKLLRLYREAIGYQKG